MSIPFPKIRELPDSPIKAKKRKSKILLKQKRPLFDGCTLFQIDVYECIRKIPYGQTRSYAWVAKAVGKPRAARAVAQALKRNPWPLIIPCHRIIESNGNLGGYAYGKKLKKMFLELEKIRYVCHSCPVSSTG